MRFPEWLCGWILQHALLFRWADYMNDTSGLRCRCGREMVDEDPEYEVVGGRRLRRGPTPAPRKPSASPSDAQG